MESWYSAGIYFIKKGLSDVLLCVIDYTCKHFRNVDNDQKHDFHLK